MSGRQGERRSDVRVRKGMEGSRVRGGGGGGDRGCMV